MYSILTKARISKIYVNNYTIDHKPVRFQPILNFAGSMKIELNTCLETKWTEILNVFQELMPTHTVDNAVKWSVFCRENTPSNQVQRGKLVQKKLAYYHNQCFQNNHSCQKENI